MHDGCEWLFLPVVIATKKREREREREIIKKKDKNAKLTL